MRKRLKIMLDMDCTLVDMLSDWLMYINFKHGTKVQLSDIHEWEMNKNPKLAHLSKDEIHSILDNQFGFWENLPWLPGAEQAFKELSANHDVFIVSAAYTGGACDGKYRWLAKNLPDFNLSNLFICSNKQMISGFDIIVDDRPATIVGFHMNGVKTAMISYPYNRSIDQVVDCIGKDYRDTKKAWAEILDFIDKESLKE